LAVGNRVDEAFEHFCYFVGFMFQIDKSFGVEPMTHFEDFKQG
jgi:hypothetical protein